MVARGTPNYHQVPFSTVYYRVVTTANYRELLPDPAGCLAGCLLPAWLAGCRTPPGWLAGFQSWLAWIWLKEEGLAGWLLAALPACLLVAGCPLLILAS